MPRFRLLWVQDTPTETTASFTELVGLQRKKSLGVYLSPRGRLIGVRYDGRWLHHRGQRGPGGKSFRMSQPKVKQVMGAAAAAIAAKALGADINNFPLQEIDL